MLKIFLRAAMAFLIAWIFISAGTAHAEEETFEGVGEYVGTDKKSLATAEERAKEQARLDVEKKICDWLKNFSRSNNLESTDEEISEVAKKLIDDTKIQVEANPTEVNSAPVYKATLKVTIETDNVRELFAIIKIDEADVFFNKDDFEGAIKLCNEAMELAPNSAHNMLAYMFRGISYFRLNQFEQAIDDLRGCW